jgi:carboxyl-terminal processing protease
MFSWLVVVSIDAEPLRKHHLPVTCFASPPLDALLGRVSMIQPARVRNHRRKDTLGASAFAVLLALNLFVATSSADTISASISTAPASQNQAVETDQALTQGLELEQAQMWSEAIRHYESAFRKAPTSTKLYQRLIISRLHFDVARRYQDESFLASLNRLSTSQTLDLYSEILSNLQTHYVDRVDWDRLMIHGTAALEVALTERKFLSTVLPNTDSGKIENFRQSIHNRISSRSTKTRFDLRANAAYVADLASRELGLSGTAAVMEFLCGAVSTLDPYTRLLSPSQLDEMFSNIEGNFVGLGVELKTEPKHLQILSVIAGGPAEQAGIEAGERIVRVEDARTSDVSSEFAADLLRGPEGSYVSITVESVTGESREMKVQRRRVDVPCVENVHFVDIENRVGYFRLTNFQKTTTRDVENALWKLHREGMRSLIIDVRGNPGGLLSAAVEVADRFLPDGRIVTTRGRNTRENADYNAHRTNTWNLPIVVLIDRDSASASEIFAGAIADQKRGTLVGETSFGKGSVQGIFRMQAAKFGLCLTTAKFYSPSGKAISQNGVTPDLAVESTYIAARPNSLGEITNDVDDAALQQAIAELSGTKRISLEQSSAFAK